MVMVILSMFSWWYTSGVVEEFERIKRMISRVGDQFSIGLLLKTLFQPFRQISANNRGGAALEDRIRAWFDRLVSRIIGAFIRLFVIVVGVIALLLTVVLACLRMIIWVLLPILPLIGVYLMLEVGILWN